MHGDRKDVSAECHDPANSLSVETHDSNSNLPLSIIIVTHRRVEALARCLESVFAAALPANTEAIVVCNGENDPARELLERFERDRRLIVIDIRRTSLAAARNAGLARARGEILYFIDDDVTVVPDLFSRALAVFATRPYVSALGGPNLTPIESGLFEQCEGSVLGSPFGSAKVRYRYKSCGNLRSADSASLMGCNLALRRSAIASLPSFYSRDVLFREYLVCNDETVLLGELSASGAIMFHDPALVTYHSRRANLSGFCSQVFRYGRGRWQNTVAFPSSLTPTFMIPALFIIYLLSLLVHHSTLYLCPLAAYSVLLMSFSILEAIRLGRPGSVLLLSITFPACHLSYGAGFLFEMLASRTSSGRAELIHRASEE
jgi:glycosyltransferase involved in cell wall biosynthesis